MQIIRPKAPEVQIQQIREETQELVHHMLAGAMVQDLPGETL